MLAGDLQLEEYVAHYFQDFPLLCPKTVSEARSGQLKANDLNRVLFPLQMTETDAGQVFPPSIYKRITRPLHGGPHSNLAHFFEDFLTPPLSADSSMLSLANAGPVLA